MAVKHSPQCKAQEIECNYLDLSLIQPDSNAKHERPFISKDKYLNRLTEDIQKTVERYLDCRTQLDPDQESDQLIYETLIEAQSNCRLLHEIEEIDRLIDNDMETGNLPNRDHIHFQWLVSQLARKLNCYPTAKMSYSEFDQIVRDFGKELFNSANTLNYLLNSSYFVFNHHGYLRNPIRVNPQVTIVIYAIGWLPGQETGPHCHADDLDAVIVLDGEIENCLFEKNNTKETVECVQNYGRGEIVTLRRKVCHKIQAKESSGVTKTLHIRLVNSSGYAPEEFSNSLGFQYENLNLPDRWLEIEWANLIHSQEFGCDGCQPETIMADRSS